MSDPAVLVINAGSSSLKYQLVRPGSGEVLASGLVERIGLPAGTVTHRVGDERVDAAVRVPDHVAAFGVLTEMFTEHGPDLRVERPVVVGHRVVHGGSRFSEPTLVTPEVIGVLRELIPLAPLHNPGNIVGIEGAMAAFPDLPHVAVFDTAFHQSMPPAAYTYAVPEAWRVAERVRRYGFHGTSHAYVSRRTAQLLGAPAEEVNVVVLHLGNGASATAVQGGRSVDTTMGMTPLEGLVMGTRPGDLDPGLVAYLTSFAGLSVQEYDHALNKQSGLLGLTGASDMREVRARASSGDASARLALDVVVHRLLKHLGGLALVMGRLDAVAFTAGIGENDAALREEVLARAGLLGVQLDVEANRAARGEARISLPDSPVAAFVVPTNEELEIAREALSFA